VGSTFSAVLPAERVIALVDHDVARAA
jgi:hypothetical protein